jgi:hypothetical protein
MRRAAAVFESAGLVVFPAPSDNSPEESTSPGGRLHLMTSVAEQGAALFYYRIAGYI